MISGKHGGLLGHFSNVCCSLRVSLDACHAWCTEQLHAVRSEAVYWCSYAACRVSPLTDTVDLTLPTACCLTGHRMALHDLGNHAMKAADDICVAMQHNVHQRVRNMHTHSIGTFVLTPCMHTSTSHNMHTLNIVQPLLAQGMGTLGSRATRPRRRPTSTVWPGTDFG
jgi:hypothetical protein